MDLFFKDFYLDLADLIDIQELPVEKRGKVIDLVHDLRKEIETKLKKFYNDGLLEGGYAMEQLVRQNKKKEYVHRSCEP